MRKQRMQRVVQHVQHDIIVKIERKTHVRVDHIQMQHEKVVVRHVQHQHQV